MSRTETQKLYGYHPDEETVEAGQLGWDGAAWQKQPLLSTDPATGRLGCDAYGWEYDIDHPLGPRWVPAPLKQPVTITGPVTIGTVDQGAGGTSAWKVDGSAVTQPVSGPLTNAELRAAAVPVSVAALPLPAGASTEAKQDVGNASLASLDGKLPAPIGGRVPVDDGHPDPQTNALTDTQLRAAPVPVSGAVTANGPLTDTQLRASAVPVSAASLPLPTGAATSANQPALGGTFNNGAETSVTAAAQVLASNASRTGLLVQNTGLQNVRVGASGVTATTGFRLAPGESITFSQPGCPTNAIYAISESGTATAVFAAEIT